MPNLTSAPSGGDTPAVTLVRGAIVVALLAAVSASGARAQSAPPAVSVAHPVVKQITEHDDFIGRFAAVDSVELRARVTGYLEQIHFADGQLVKAGDLLFTIDQRPYLDALDQAQAQVASAKATLEYASGDLERADALMRSGNITGQTADQRRQAALAARASLDNANAALSRAQLDMTFTEIRAPVSGRISRRLVSIGNLVTANETVLSTVVSIDPIQFYFDVDERNFLDYLRDFVPGAQPGRAGTRDVMVALTGEDKPSHNGVLDFVDVRLDQASGTIRARAVFPNKDGSLTPGLFGRVTIAGSQPYQAVLVPDEALATDQDHRIVFVVDQDGKVAARTIRLGPHVDGYRVVREGLAGADTIVVNGLARIRPGTLVSPKMTDLPPSRIASE